MGTPFKRIAFDLVGPYPCTAWEHKYFDLDLLLFPLSQSHSTEEKIDEQSVVSAMVEFFSWSSLPSEILNPLTAVSIYIRPDYFSCVKNIVKNQLLVKKSCKIHQTIENKKFYYYTKFDIRATTVTKVTMMSKFT